MTVNRTTLLDLPLPVTGTEAGVWGDITNNGLTQYLDISIAGRTALTSSDFTAGALTISTTEGDSSATNIGATSAQYATLYVSSLAQNSTITAPSSNRAYRVVNADSTYTLTVKATGQTGVTFPVGTSGTVVFNGTDYILLGTFGSATALKLNGSSSGTATLVAPAAASTFTYTLPNSTTTLVGTDATQTLTNKQINPRAVPAGVTSGNLTINGDTTDLYEAEGLTGSITFLQPSGTPVDGQKLIIRIEDDGNARGITWTTTSGAFRAVGVNLPATTTATKVTYVGCIYNATDIFWDVIASVTQT